MLLGNCASHISGPSAEPRVPANVRADAQYSGTSSFPPPPTPIVLLTASNRMRLFPATRDIAVLGLITRMFVMSFTMLW